VILILCFLRCLVVVNDEMMIAKDMKCVHRRGGRPAQNSYLRSCRSTVRNQSIQKSKRQGVRGSATRLVLTTLLVDTALKIRISIARLERACFDKMRSLTSTMLFI